MYTVRKHIAHMTGMAWFIVVDDADCQIGPYYDDHDVAQAAANELNEKENSMTKFRYVVEIETDTQKHADKVIQERIGFDEDYGFNYTIEVAPEKENN